MAMFGSGPSQKLHLSQALPTIITNCPILKMLLSYAVFIGVLIWRPNGLFSK
jgi:ABC-type branched-subunit amino acid transport system permease subunit